MICTSAPGLKRLNSQLVNRSMDSNSVMGKYFHLVLISRLYSEKLRKITPRSSAVIIRKRKAEYCDIYDYFDRTWIRKLKKINVLELFITRCFGPKLPVSIRAATPSSIYLEIVYICLFTLPNGYSIHPLLNPFIPPSCGTLSQPFHFG